MAPVDQTFLKSAPWIFRMDLELPDLDSDSCWKILLKDDNWQHWHPEVTKISWYDKDEYKQRSVGARRSVVFHDALFDALLLGGVALEEHFDVWDDDNHVLGFYMTKVGRPTWLTYSSIREEFRVEEMNGGCRLVRTVAMNPTFISRYVLGFVAYPRLEHIFAEKCATRFQKALKEGTLKV